MTITLERELSRISRNEKHSHHLTSRVDTAKERVSKLENGHEDKISEDAG